MDAFVGWVWDTSDSDDGIIVLMWLWDDAVNQPEVQLLYDRYSRI
jgi:hypothetical protein